MRGLSPPKIILSESEKTELVRLSKQHKTAQQIVKRAQIILLAAQRNNNRQIMRQLGARRTWFAYGVQDGSKMPKRSYRYCSACKTTRDQASHQP